MTIMLERVIFQVLSAGREEVNENPNFLRDFFRDEHGPGLTEEEIDELETFWRNVKAIDPDGSKQTGVSIVHQFPREASRYPLWSIVLLQGGEDQQFLGDEAGVFGDHGEDVLSSIWAKSYAVFTYTSNPMMTLYYHELLKFFLSRGRPFMKSAAGGYILSTRFSEGDMVPRPELNPTHMFVRRFQIDLVREERVLGEPQDRGTRLRGIYGPPEGPDDIEGVIGGVTTYNEGDES